MRRWLEIAVVVPAGAADVVADRLVEIGAPGIREEDVGEDSTRRRLVAHFAVGKGVVPQKTPDPFSEVERLLAELEPYFPGAARAPVESRLVDEEDWAEGWRRAFPPLEIGERVRIRPPWEAPASGGRVDVVIEPAMAFGTGQHASTHGCLLAIEELLEPGAAVLDVGTGSGILAIAAALLGAGRAIGVDTDPIAIAAARENAERSRAGERVAFAVGGVECVRDRFAIVVANLYSGVIATLMPELARRLRPKGALVLSGLLAADAPDLVERGMRAGLAPAGERTIDGWTTLVLRSPDAASA